MSRVNPGCSNVPVIGVMLVIFGVRMNCGCRGLIIPTYFITILGGVAHKMCMVGSPHPLPYVDPT